MSRNSGFKNTYLKVMVLGQNYSVNSFGTFRFIKVTNKGYNFFNEETNEVLYFKHHYYKEKNKEFCFRFPKWLSIHEKKEN